LCKGVDLLNWLR